MEEYAMIDYQAAAEEFRRVEHIPDNPVRSSGKDWVPPMIDGYVDYQAAIRAWDKEQAGKYTLYNADLENEGRL